MTDIAERTRAHGKTTHRTSEPKEVKEGGGERSLVHVRHVDCNEGHVAVAIFQRHIAVLLHATTTTKNHFESKCEQQQERSEAFNEQQQ